MEMRDALREAKACLKANGMVAGLLPHYGYPPTNRGIRLYGIPSCEAQEVGGILARRLGGSFRASPGFAIIWFPTPAEQRNSISIPSTVEEYLGD